MRACEHSVVNTRTLMTGGGGSVEWCSECGAFQNMLGKWTLPRREQQRYGDKA